MWIAYAAKNLYFQNWSTLLTYNYNCTLLAFIFKLKINDLVDKAARHSVSESPSVMLSL